MRSQSLSEGVHFEWPLVSPPGLIPIEFGVGFVVVREAPPIVRLHSCDRTVCVVGV